MVVTYAGEAWPLIPISLIAGIVFLLGFRYASDQAAIRRTKNKLQAHLFELRLFLDEPAVIWRSQLALIRDNLRLIVLLLRPAVFLAIPATLLLAQLDAVYGRAPLEVGRTCLLTAETLAPLPESIALEPAPEIAPDIPAVRMPAASRVAWRIRPLRPFAGNLRIRLGNGVVEKSVRAGRGPGYQSEKRVRALMDYLLHATESRLPDGPVRWIEVEYPAVRIEWLGMRLHWLIWFLLLSTVSALAAKPFLRVAF